MTQGRNGNVYELDPRSGAFVNDTLPGMDGSVLGANTVPETAEGTSARRYALTLPRGRNVWAAAIGGGMLALGMAYVSTRMRAGATRSFFSMLMRPRSKRWSFAR